VGFVRRAFSSNSLAELGGEKKNARRSAEAIEEETAALLNEHGENAFDAILGRESGESKRSQRTVGGGQDQTDTPTGSKKGSQKKKKKVGFTAGAEERFSVVEQRSTSSNEHHSTSPEHGRSTWGPDMRHSSPNFSPSFPLISGSQAHLDCSQSGQTPNGNSQNRNTDRISTHELRQFAPRRTNICSEELVPDARVHAALLRAKDRAQDAMERKMNESRSFGAKFGSWISGAGWNRTSAELEKRVRNANSSSAKKQDEELYANLLTRVRNRERLADLEREYLELKAGSCCFRSRTATWAQVGNPYAVSDDSGQYQGFHALRKRGTESKRNRERQIALEDYKKRTLQLADPKADHKISAGKTIAEFSRTCSIMFVSLAHFAEHVDNADRSSRDVLGILDLYFYVFDDMCARFDVQKIETIGEDFVCAVGLGPHDSEVPHSALLMRLLMFAWTVLRFADNLRKTYGSQGKGGRKPDRGVASPGGSQYGGANHGTGCREYRGRRGGYAGG
jgi:hypothetical protein